MPPEKKINGRYIVKAELGEGGMAVVYRAYDPPPMDRDVAVKTIVEGADRLSLQLLYQEYELLKSMSHPNIVDIFDMGEFEDSGAKKPFWVMPLLPGQPLDELIRNASERLTVERVVEIITQTCRGLQAAHERGLVHGDLKPSNIFVMEDDSVKIVDFGVAHVVDSCSQSSGFRKGALLYMAPEQIQFKPASPQSDIFSLGVVCYEALTRRQPFVCPREEDGIQAVLKLIPPPASEINPGVTEVVSRVLHKAMAKQSWQRFSSAREFGQVLQQAFRNQPIELLDPAHIRPRLERAQKAFESCDYQFANEILSELEAEGNINSAMTLLKANIERAIREKVISQMLESAKVCFEKNEDPLALQKIRQILELDANHTPALDLRSKIENRRSEREIDSWIQLVERYVANHAFEPAQEALESLLRIRPTDARASKLLLEVEASEQEYRKLRAEKAQAYQNALHYWRNGEVSQALSQMALVLELDRRAPDTPSAESGRSYQSFYDTVRSAHDALNDAYAEARRQIAEKRARLRNLEEAKSVAVQASGTPADEPNSIEEPTPAFVVRCQPEAEFQSITAEVEGLIEERAGTPAKHEPRPRKPWVRMAIPRGLWATSAVLVLAAVLLTAPPWRSLPSALVLVPVEFQVSPAGATLEVDGKPQQTSQPVALSVGHHQVEASLDGYESRSTTVTIAPRPTPPVELTLRPLAQDFRITTPDLKDAEVFLDDHSLGTLKDGTFLHAFVTLGQHKIRVQLRRAQKQPAGFSFESKPGRPPKVELPIEAGQSQLLVISSKGNSGFIAGTMSSVSVKLDGGALGTLTDRGLELTNLRPGNHQLILGEGARAKTMSFESGASPRLNAVIYSERNEGDQSNAPRLAARGSGQGSFSTTPPTIRTKEAVSTARFSTQKPIPTGRVGSRAPARLVAHRPGPGSDFEAVINSSDPVILRDFLSRNPSGESHDRVAERLDDLLWANTKNHDVASLNTYLGRFPGGRHADQARTQIATLAQVSVPNTDEPRVAPTIPAPVDDKSAVLRLIRQYQQAYQNESVDQLKVLWPNLGEPQIRALNDFFGHAQLVALDCKLIGNPIIAGNDSTLKLTQTLTYVAHATNHIMSSKTQLIMHLRKQLSASGRSDWRIESIR